jgi:hypothetical protein
MKKFAGIPAARPFARNPGVVMKLVVLVDENERNPFGFGFCAARNPRNVAFARFVLV